MSSLDEDKIKKNEWPPPDYVGKGQFFDYLATSNILISLVKILKT